MATLTDRQRQDLDKAILTYLQARNLQQTAASFRSETSIEFQQDPKLEGLLEKKWTAVIRLQKKVMDLEKQISSLQEEIRSAPASRNVSAVDWVPKTPARFALPGHRDIITRVAFHPVISLVATASEDMTIRIWDWESGECERTLRGHTKGVKDVDFDVNGRRLVSASADLTIRLWDTELWDTPSYGGTSLHGHDHTISCARFLENGDFVVSASRDKTIKVWNVATKFCVRTILAHSEWVRYVVPSDDSRFLGSCSADHTGRIWDYKTGLMKSELRGHSNSIEVIIFAPVNAYPFIRTLIGSKDNQQEPGAYAVTGARDNLIVIWDAQSGLQLRTLTGHDGWIRGLVFHPSGKFLLSASDDKSIRVWDLASGRCTRTVEAHSHFVSCIAWGTAVIGGANNDGPGLEGSSRQAPPQGKRINVVATGGQDLVCRIWTP